jgi:glycosyltransferase involved in cell wall biosynthesis
MTKNISVAIIEPVGGHGGMDYYDFGLCAGLLAAQCGVSLYSCDETSPPAIPNLRFYAVYKRIYGKANRWIRALRFIRGSVAAISRAVLQGDQICHLHLFHGEAQELILVFLAKLSGRKVIITVHDVESFSPVAISRTMINRIYGLADALIVHNKVSEEELTNKLGNAPVKINIIPHGNYLDTDHRLADPQDARRKLDIGETRRVILFFGQIKDVKGLDILIEAMPIVVNAIPEVTLLIAGRPWKKDFASYDALIDKLGIRDRCVLHLRYIGNDEIALFFAAADVVVLPYRRIYQSGVILMAMSYGRAVVVSDLPGMTETVSDGATGYVFRQGSKDALAEQLIRVLKDDEGRMQVAERAMEHMRVNYDWMVIGNKTANVYRNVLGMSSGE